MARPQSRTSRQILSLPATMSAKDAVAALKAKGMKTTESNIYRVRRLAKKSAGKRPAPAAAPVTRPRAVAAPRRGRMPASSAAMSAESLLRALAAEMGLGRAVDLLHAERAKVRGLIGG